MKIRMSIVIRGSVQGVSFRYYTQLSAHELGVTGWVRNLPDGSVAALMEGDETAVQSLVEWCRYGPPAARVKRIDTYREAYLGEFHDFKIVR